MPTATTTGATVRRRAAAAVAGLGALALTLLGLPAQAHAAAAPATATTPTASTNATARTAAAATGSDAAYQRSCGEAAKGQFACFALRRTDVKAAKGVQPLVATPSGYGPSDLTSAYNLPADGGAGQTVAIVDAYDDPSAEADLSVYRAQYGLPACTSADGCFTKADQRGGTDYPAANAGWASEISLDLDMVSAVAPAAKILLVEADSADIEALGAAVDTAVALGAKYVSNSYGTGYDTTAGSGESATETTEEDAHYDHPGVAVVASSGDSKYGVSYPASSQYVTSVGGTALTRDSGSPRGWTESVWNNSYGGPGSGCSLYEPKPSFQSGTGCDKRAVADVSAVADPVTGVAVYQTYGGSGWNVFGGTSAASPIIAGVYADAGTPVAGSYPNSYPYLASGSGLNDVTSGSNGSCSPAVLCTAGAGYDGPTGLGTPNGLSAFRSGPHGEVEGTVTDAATGKALAGARVAVDGFSATTGTDGGYQVTVPAGSHGITVTAFGYAPGGDTDVSVDDNATVTRDFALKAVGSHTVSGKVTDGSGHGWPLYAKLTVDGTALSTFTDPVTGAYALKLPEGASYTLHITPEYTGYQAVAKTVTVGKSDQKADVAVPVDPNAGSTPGYRIEDTAPVEAFDSTTAAPDGWSAASTSPYATAGWEFDDPAGRGNLTGGDGAFAVADAKASTSPAYITGTLDSASYDLSRMSAPELDFGTAFQQQSGAVPIISASTDGGSTWNLLWVGTGSLGAGSTVDIPLTSYAGASSLRVRFQMTYYGSADMYWELDDVQVGERTPQAVPGGLVVGTVRDANDGSAVTGAALDVPGAATKAVSAATPDDPAVGGGLYHLFAPRTGTHQVTAAKGGYTSSSAAVRIAADRTVRQDYTLKAGRLTVTPGRVDAATKLGGTTTQRLTVTNTGTAPATLRLAEQPGDTEVTGAGTPLKETRTDYTPTRSAKAQAGPAKTGTSTGTSTGTAADAGTGGTWQSGTAYPTTIMDNAVAADGGTIYSAFGYDGWSDTAAMWSMDPATGTWTQRASAADTRESPAYGFIDGKLYATGGWGSDYQPDAKLEIYDPATDTWSTGASVPIAYASSGSGVLDGKLYVVGGCGGGHCAGTEVQVYDPATDSWSAAADYPEPIGAVSCGALSGTLYCAGGSNDDADVSHAYSYDPAKNAWTAIADLPSAMSATAGTVAAGQFVLTTGISAGAATNKGYAYDPATNRWSSLPNAPTATYGAGAAPGLYKIGGSTQVASPLSNVEVLPGYGPTGATDVRWLRESRRTLTLRPGQHATVTVTLTASAAGGITKTGVYDAELPATSDTPYHVPAVPVTLTVKPSKGHGGGKG
ncbi:carboxypeptidase regulatory-like domain-containing protein [Actinacidiphila sp. bgisy144]|uniref:carboxypeptidase regulatory-like domain-containing protein n=1 Tax=Actinacidiphila sp. bgisy144 TaxID=3413791 RepID=UPI003EBD8B77